MKKQQDEESCQLLKLNIFMSEFVNNLNEIDL